MTELIEALDGAVTDGKILESSRENILLLLNGSKGDLALRSIKELVAKEEWGEINDRFFKTLAFGTGGLRGRTIGRVVTSVELGQGGPNERPEHPAVGTATMNFFNLSRAIRGMVTYMKRYLEEEGVERRPRFALAHDTRHFSRDFAEFCAKCCTDLGVDAYLFEGPRSTPELSYVVREVDADAGVVLTASHNPAHDCGFKAYLSDGAQLIEPIASGVIAEVNSIETEEYCALPEGEQGELVVIGKGTDQRYMEALKSLLLRPELLENGGTKVVYTNLHGTGGHIIVPLMRDLGFEVLTVPEQDSQDGRFPTVDSPNPENPPALAKGIELAITEGAEIVIGTDPDSDRMGVAVRNEEGEMQLLTGNQIGSLMAWYRTKTMFDQGIITQSNRSRAVLVKTLVTTELQQAIADDFGVSLVNTLTGFKYIAGKLEKYERAIPKDKYDNYRDLTAEESRKLRLEYSRFFIFGGEESYGYLGNDVVRDKDANGAAVMFAELAAYAKSEKTSLLQLLDDLYEKYGYFLEIGKSLVMEGAEGAAQIKALATSYSEAPPKSVDGSDVVSVKDYGNNDFFDSEGDEFPKEAMIIVELEDGRRFAVRPSGTEPKIKYYLFGRDEPGATDLNSSKENVRKSLDSLWSWLNQDASDRVSS